MESGPASTWSEDLRPSDWWICTDWPGPEENGTWTVEVTWGNWRNFKGYDRPPGHSNTIWSRLHDRSGALLGSIKEIEVISNFRSSNITIIHRYTLEEAETPA